MSRDINRHKKYYREDFTLRPFKDLQKRINQKRKQELLKIVKRSKRAHNNLLSIEDEKGLFLKAMQGVSPLQTKKGRGINAVFSMSPPSVSRPQPIELDEKIGFDELCALVEGKVPIDVSSTPEYISGGQDCLARALSQGFFTIQAYLDLHGLDRISALVECEEFFKEAILESKRCIAIIHGRGLCSKDKPILKTAVCEWLKKGPFRKRILAFSSAPYWDGGAGVTYVLLSPYHKNNKK